MTTEKTVYKVVLHELGAWKPMSKSFEKYADAERALEKVKKEIAETWADPARAFRGLKIEEIRHLVRI